MQDNSKSFSIPEALARAQAHWNAGQADQAEILCQRVLAQWPGHSDASHLMGLMAHAYGNLDLAFARASASGMLNDFELSCMSVLREESRPRKLLSLSCVLPEDDCVSA